MPITKFVPDRIPRRSGEAIDAAMTVWQVLLNFIDWTTTNIVSNYKSGTATIAQGATSTVVTHSLNNPSYKASVVPIGNPGSAWWISSKSASGFTINLASGAPVGGANFEWSVKGD